MATLLIANDDRTFLDFSIQHLENDHKLFLAQDWNEVLEKFESNLWRLNATVLDINMPGLSVDPFTMLEKLSKSNPLVPMIIVSNERSPSEPDFLKMNIFQHLKWPLNKTELQLTIQSAVNHHRALRRLEHHEDIVRREVKYYQHVLNIDVPALRQRLKNLDTDNFKAPVLIRSEPGSRPGMVAKIISEKIDRKLLFTKVCSESLRNLIPYKMQNGDVLYLEGIENLGHEEHAFLLRMTKNANGRSRQNEDQKQYFRLITSISTSIEQDVRENREFRQLMEVLGAIEILIEPLRMRKRELRGIITSVFEMKQRAYQSKVQAISRELFEVLVQYHWPLNFDELDLILEALIITSQDEVLSLKHLHQLDFSDIALSEYPTLNDIADQHIKKALRLTMGNKSKAAKMLGITPKTLYSRIRN